MPTGWLVNDRLTCIPGTTTLWHHLLEWLPGLHNMCMGDYKTLASRIEVALEHSKPDYVIRNASYFRRLNTDVPTIALWQDTLRGRARRVQRDVCQHARIVVANSSLAAAESGVAHVRVIPLGVDFDFFRRCEPHHAVPSGAVLFVGAANNHPKGFDRLWRLVETTEHEFCLVLKDYSHVPDHPRVTVLRRVGQEEMRRIYSACAALVCTSREETQHLAGIEAAACGVPVVATPVGIYPDMAHVPGWGCVSPPWGLADALRDVLSRRDSLDPRRAFQERFDLSACQDDWRQAMEDVLA